MMDQLLNMTPFSYDRSGISTSTVCDTAIAEYIIMYQHSTGFQW